MSKSPLVSVICLCFNHEKFVEETLQSVINQTYKNIEIIVLDDYSVDNSVKIIEQFINHNPNIIFIKNETNLGNTKSFNKALKKSNGNFVIDLAADDVLLPNCVELQIEKFENSSYENLGIVYGNAELISENGNYYSYYFDVDISKKVIEKRKTGNIYLDIISGGNSLCSVSAMIKKEVLEKLNGFDENLDYEDLDFWIRSSKIYNFDFIDEILVKKRIVPNSLGTKFHDNKKKSKKINFSTYKILQKTLKLNQTKPENRAVLKRIHYEMVLNYKTNNINLLLKYIFLEIQFRLKNIF